MEEVDHTPIRSPDIWVAVTRPVLCMTAFADDVKLYQPDATPFCPYGTTCKIPGKDHQSYYIHTPRPQHPEVVTNIVNNPTAPPCVIPFVKNAYSIPERCTSRVPGIPSDRTVLVYVHGFRQTYLKVLSCLNHLNFRLRGEAPSEKPSETSKNVCLIGFVWPSHLMKAAYLQARKKAAKAAGMLSQLIRTLHAHGNTVHLVGHSLGCRVVLHSLQSLGPSHRVSSALLLAAAVPSDVMSPTGEFPRATLEADRIAVVHTLDDATLRNVFPIGEHHDAAHHRDHHCFILSSSL